MEPGIAAADVTVGGGVGARPIVALAPAAGRHRLEWRSGRFGGRADHEP
jgi:hypothetical protein